MRIVLQKVQKASVKVNSKIVGKIGKGYVLLVGFCKDFKEEMLEYFVKKIVNLRIFEDENGKMNKNIKTVKGEILIISQFTLCANTKKGNRPSFDLAMKPELAKKYFNIFISKFKKENINISTGIFGKNMKVSLINDGPVTIFFQKNPHRT